MTEEGWEIINLVGRFEKPERRQVVIAKIVDPTDRPLWLRRLSKSTRHPKANTFDVVSINNPINVKMSVKSDLQYIITPDFAPVESLETIFECVAPMGLVLKPNTIFNVFFRNERVLRTVPLEVVVSLHCSRDFEELESLKKRFPGVAGG